MNFWANKLSGGNVPRQTIPAPFTYATPQQVQPSQPVYTPNARLVQGSICPGCGSERYRPNHGSYALACPDCGYHPRFEQSGYGEGSLRGETEATAARQIPTSGFTLKGAIAELNAGGGDHMHKQN